jgi:hypothetical protein
MRKSLIYQPKRRNLNTFNRIILGMFVLFILGVITLRPVRIMPEKDLQVLQGKLIGIDVGGVNDLTLTLEGRKEVFYVNRGLERGLDLRDLKSKLINQQVTLKYPAGWSILNPGKRTVHLSKIEHRGQTIFTELE